jgi:hypothetical protein
MVAAGVFEQMLRRAAAAISKENGKIATDYVWFIIGGDPTPSRAAIEMTKRIFEMARGLGIEVRDHIVVGRDGHASPKGQKLI